MKTKRDIIVLLLVFLAGLVAGYRFYPYFMWQKRNKLINPLLRFYKIEELKPFSQEIASLIEKQKNDGRADEVSVYFRSLSDGIWVGIDERKKFCPASLLKVPTMIAYLKIAETDPGILRKRLEYKHSDEDLTQNITSEAKMEEGAYYSVDELLGEALAMSDNTAHNALVRYLDTIDKNILNETYKDMGIIIEEATSATSDFVSLKNYVSMFRVIYNAAYLNEKMSNRALRYLINSPYKEGIVAGVPDGIVVAHKFGERGFYENGKKELHDVGIVYHPDNPYLVGIMTKGTNFYDLSLVIKEISALIYEKVDSRYRKGYKEDFELSE